jgi:hypothetical protein
MWFVSYRCNYNSLHQFTHSGLSGAILCDTGAEVGKLQTYIVANYDTTSGLARRCVSRCPRPRRSIKHDRGVDNNPTTLNRTPSWQGTINGLRGPTMPLQLLIPRLGRTIDQDYDQQKRLSRTGSGIGSWFFAILPYRMTLTSVTTTELFAVRHPRRIQTALTEPPRDGAVGQPGRSVGRRQQSQIRGAGSAFR